MEQLRVIIAGGGTGGHIFPAVAIGQALQRLRPGTQLLFVGALGKMEMERVPQEGFEIIGLDIAGFNRKQLWKNAGLPLKLLKSRIQARRILKNFDPAAVIGVGGYASFPMLSAAQSMGIPTVIQEQNSYAGKSNKILGRRAEAICVAYNGMDKFFPAERLIITGNPVRKSITEMTAEPEEVRSWFGLDASRKTVLVIGGSLGAKSINESIDAGLEDLLNEGVQVIWQTGQPYFEQAQQRAAAFSDRVKVVNFIKEMAFAYTVADFVVSRAGALAIAELCIAGKPVVFVPYPYAAEGHQESNALALVKQGAALLVHDAQAPGQLVQTLKGLMKDEKQQVSMAENLRAMAIKDADERIAHKVFGIVNSRQ